MLDYLIVGAGLAGSTLAYYLKNEGLKIGIINETGKPSSSQVAGGMFNPITGKYLAKTWLADHLWPAMYNHYRAIENKTNQHFFYETGLLRVYANEQNKTNFLKQIEKNSLAEWLETWPESEAYPLGGLYIKKAGWVDVKKYLEVLHSEFISQNLFHDLAFNYNRLKIVEDNISYENLKAKKIIFAEGYYGTENPFFKHLPFSPVKGEVLEYELNIEPPPHIINQGKWLFKIAEKKIRVGSTYSWKDLDFYPTQKGRQEIDKAIQNMIEGEKSMSSHLAGVRPATEDRRPFLGQHGTHKNLYIFNGLGTKGVSLVPYFAQIMTDFLENQKELPPEVTITRFNSLT